MSLILPFYRQVFSDLPGGKLYFYVGGSGTGTSIPKNVYADAARTDALPQPLQLDSIGQVPEFFCEPGNYFVVGKKASGADGFTRDQVAPVGEGTGSGSDDHLVLASPDDTIPGTLLGKVTSITLDITEEDAGPLGKKLKLEVDPEQLPPSMRYLETVGFGACTPLPLAFMPSYSALGVIIWLPAGTLEGIDLVGGFGLGETWFAIYEDQNAGTANRFLFNGNAGLSTCDLKANGTFTSSRAKLWNSRQALSLTVQEGWHLVIMGKLNGEDPILLASQNLAGLSVPSNVQTPAFRLDGLLSGGDWPATLQVPPTANSNVIPYARLEVK